MSSKIRRRVFARIWGLLCATALFSTFLKAQTPAVWADSVQTTASIVEVPILARNLSNIAALSLTMNFDNQVISFVSLQKTSSTIGGSMLSNVSGGKLLIAWFSLTPTTIANDTLVKIRFQKGTGCYSNLAWDTLNFGACQITDLFGNDLAVQYADGFASLLDTSAPQLVAPLDAQAAFFYYDDFLWQQSRCAINYPLQIATDSLFANVKVDTILGDTTFLATELLPSSSYFWRVGKTDTRGLVFWSDTARFTTVGATALAFPAATATVYGDTVAIPLVIADLARADSLSVLVRFDSAQVNLVDTLFGSAVFQNFRFAKSDTAFSIQWKGAAVNAAASDTLVWLLFERKAGCSNIPLAIDTAASGLFFKELPLAMSNFGNGNLTFLSLQSVGLLAPANDAQDVSTQPAFQWATLPCSPQHRLQLALDSAMAVLVLDTVLNGASLGSFAAVNLLDTTRYFWRVARFNEAGDSTWSATWAFATQTVVQARVGIENIFTYADTLRFPVLVDSLRNAVAFDLYLNTDTTAVHFIGYTDTTNAIGGMVIEQQGSQVRLRWTATDTAAFLDADTLVQLIWLRKQFCATVFTWDAASQFTHTNPKIALLANYQSATAFFLQNTPPPLFLPADSATVFALPTLVWGGGCEPTRRLLIATDSAFKSVVLDTILQDTALRIGNLQPLTRYFWQVSRTDALDSTFAAPRRTFVTQALFNTALVADSVRAAAFYPVAIRLDSAFNLQSLDLTLVFDTAHLAWVGGVGLSLPTLSADAIGDTVRLLWQSNQGGLDVLGDTIGGLLFAQKTGCASVIRWVKTELGYDWQNAPAPAIVRTDAALRWVNQTPATLQEPDSTVFTKEENIVFQWSEVPCRLRFTLQVALDTAFSNVVFEQTNLDTAAFTLPSNALTDSTLYYWRVGALDASDTLRWSAAKHFGINYQTATFQPARSWVRLYPNPVADWLWLETSTAPTFASVYNSAGSEVLAFHVKQSDRPQGVSVAALPDGLYVLVLRAANGASLTRTFIKNH